MVKQRAESLDKEYGEGSTKILKEIASVLPDRLNWKEEWLPLRPN